MILRSVARSHVGKVREKNQDALLDRAEWGVFMVADGMGGEQAGEEASAQVVATVARAAEAFFRRPPSGPSQIEGMLRDALLEANQDVLQIAAADPSKRGMGSTGSLLCLHRGVFFIAHVGDSRVYLARGGQVRQLTRDHTLVWALYEQGAIPRERLETHPDRHLLTQCIGSPRPIKVDTHEGDAQPGDLFLICSDGLTGYADEQRIFEILLDESTPLDTRADRLIEAALEAGGGDNVSVVLVKVEALEPSDDWKPEATAPPQRIEVTAQEAIPDADVMTLYARKAEAEQKRRRRRMGIAAAGVVGAAVLAAVLFAALRPVRVALHVADPTEQAALADALVRATREGTSTVVYEGPVARDGKGLFVRLPRAGAYVLSFERRGYVPKEVPVRAAFGSGHARAAVAGAWVPSAWLELKLPSAPRATAMRIEREAVEGKPGGQRTIDGAQLEPGATLREELEPGIRYTVVIQAPGCDDFVATYRMTPGERRTVQVTLKPAGGGA